MPTCPLSQLKTRGAVQLVAEMSARRDQCSHGGVRPWALPKAAAGRAKCCQCGQAGCRHPGW